MTVVLKKSVNKNERYYNISILANLFGDYIVERIFGNTRYSSPTGNLKSIFTNKQEAYYYLEEILSIKIKKGYKIFSSSIDTNYEHKRNI
ncbi:WGR domain-containing protein [Aliarcobacter cryaerophilus]|uniref:WGR domain-containing protein n=1 Tax=Aliarcobacter cryaerophilus TaxID=28198 RepID=UPI003DA3C0C1